jgi:hypothetical protein
VVTEVFDGLRAFYSRREGVGSAPAFSAAMLLAFLCGVNLLCIATLLDTMVHGHLTILPWLGRHRTVLVAFGIAIAWIHVNGAKRIGIYDRKGPALSTDWSRVFIRYCAATAVLFFASLLTAFLTRAL